MLVILDLNGTLADIYNTRYKHIPHGIQPSAIHREQAIFLRPYLREFLDFLFENVDVAIWTSRMRHNAMAVIKALFTPEEIRKLKFIRTRQDCEIFEDLTSVKDLSKVVYNEGHIVMIDNDESKIKLTSNARFIGVTEFKAGDISDRELFRLTYMLCELLDEEDVDRTPDISLESPVTSCADSNSG